MSSVSGDLPTAILEGPPGPPGEKGIFQDLGHWVYILLFETQCASRPQIYFNTS